MTADGIECTDAVSAADATEIGRLAHAAEHADHVPPLSDHALLHVRYGGADTVHVLMRAGGELIAYAHLDLSDPIQGAQAELVVDPRHRGKGHGRALLLTLLERSPRLSLWAHGQLPASRRLAEGMGLVRQRVLLRMSRPLDGSLPDVQLPAGGQLRAFRPAVDEAALLALNNDAFANHPEQGDWTLEDLARREREPWFDAEGLQLLAIDGRLAGFVWTKVHGDSGADAPGHSHAPIGEIYVVGVAPGARRRGLGRTLTAVGLAHLAARGLPDVMLYVDESNSGAVALYESLGFERVGVDVLFGTS